MLLSKTAQIYTKMILHDPESDVRYNHDATKTKHNVLVHHKCNQT